MTKQAVALPEAGQVFSLPPDREAAFWALAQATGVDCATASALTLLRVVDRGRALAGRHPEGFGAACEVELHARRGASIQFLGRPSALGNENDVQGGGADRG